MKKKISISLYWKCQLIGWSLAALYWQCIGFFGGNNNFFIGLLQFISDVALYILITHLYRNFSVRHHWQQLGIGSLLKRIIPAVVIMAIAYLLVTMLKVHLFQQWFHTGKAGPFIIFFKENWLPMLMAGARLMCIWLLAYHLYYYGKREISLVKENARLALIAKDAQLNNLSAQLNPHFLFNSLNTIKALVIENPNSARRAIDLLSDLLRTSLYGNYLLLHPIKIELGFVTDYLELEQLRLEERLQFSIACEDELGYIPILRYSIQVLVENAVKHGISKQKKGGIIDIKVTRYNDLVKIIVQNPGDIATGVPLEGLGLKNLNERLLLQYRGEAIFNISDSDGIVSAVIMVPEI